MMLNAGALFPEQHAAADAGHRGAPGGRRCVHRARGHTQQPAGARAVGHPAQPAVCHTGAIRRDTAVRTGNNTPPHCNIFCDSFSPRKKLSFF